MAKRSQWTKYLMRKISEDIQGHSDLFDVSRNDFGNVTVLDFSYEGEPAGRSILSREKEGWLNVQVEMPRSSLDRNFDLYALRMASEVAEEEDRAIRKTVRPT